ncbi:class I SAM-dependent methyltransferase [Pedobacter arcticus]|uniref:class I SAM-dependent methyltransferase n=1 Tax=Pedobacter arcticus TaxID=752140 RepID=UPI0002D303DD|nr:class I SAM-dependent methyltransferase [Pedobacter arcticus]
MRVKERIKSYLSFENRMELRLFKNNLRALFFFGSNFYCVCCNRSFRKFLPYGNVSRKNAMCPYCASLERTRLLNLYLLNETDIFIKKKKTLHFAPEYMLSKKLRNSLKNDYVSSDLDPSVADIQQDIQSLTFKDTVFDYVICCCVLGHVADEIKAIDEIYRVLKIGGTAIINTVINLKEFETLELSGVSSEDERLKFYGEKDLLRLHGLDFRERLARKNVKIEMVDYSLKYSKEENKRQSLGNKERELFFVIEKLDK